jgi:hypothetical protein
VGIGGPRVAVLLRGGDDAVLPSSLGPARRFWTVSGITVAISVFAYWHLAPWVWWLPIVAAMASILYLTHPGDARERPPSPTATESSVLTSESGSEAAVEG